MEVMNGSYEVVNWLFNILFLFFFSLSCTHGHNLLVSLIVDTIAFFPQLQSII